MLDFFKFDSSATDMRLVGDYNRAESDGNAKGIKYSSRIFKVSKNDKDVEYLLNKFI